MMGTPGGVPSGVGHGKIRRSTSRWRLPPAPIHQPPLSADRPALRAARPFAPEEGAARRGGAPLPGQGHPDRASPTPLLSRRSGMPRSPVRGTTRGIPRSSSRRSGEGASSVSTAGSQRRIAPSIPRTTLGSAPSTSSLITSTGRSGYRSSHRMAGTRPNRGAAPWTRRSRLSRSPTNRAPVLPGFPRSLSSSSPVRSQRAPSTTSTAAAFWSLPALMRTSLALKASGSTATTEPEGPAATAARSVWKPMLAPTSTKRQPGPIRRSSTRATSGSHTPDAKIVAPTPWSAAGTNISKRPPMTSTSTGGPAPVGPLPSHRRRNSERRAPRKPARRISERRRSVSCGFGTAPRTTREIALAMSRRKPSPMDFTRP